LERIKLAHQSLINSLNVNYLSNEKLINSVFALNDIYELNGSSAEMYFKELEKYDTFEQLILKLKGLTNCYPGGIHIFVQNRD
jgi:hypothetical protein